MNKNTKTSGLSAADRDRMIIEHVARFRLSTVESIRKTLLPNSSHNAVRKIVDRLCSSELLQKFTLLHPTKYFVLGKLGMRRMGVSVHRAESLGPQSLPQEFALLSFATLGTNRRLRLNTVEVQQRCSWLPLALSVAPHCIDQKNILELVRVDLGGPADYVARKCAADVQKRTHFPAFLELVDAGQFRLVIVTATTEKVTAIRNALGNHLWPQGLLIHFAVVPQLLFLKGDEKNA